MARHVGAPVEESEPGHRGIYYCYVRDFVGPRDSTLDGPEFYRSGDAVAYVFPSDAGGLESYRHTVVLSRDLRQSSPA